MTFYDISIKMLTVNFKRYKLYFLCNVFAVALFYSFAAIFTNKKFMDIRIVDSIISSNICAPSIFVGIFLVLFIPYSYNAFLRNRKYEYGVLMTLGMSEKEVLINMLLENCVVAVISLISGMILGTIISFGFYFIINTVIGVSALRWYFNADSYKFTAILYGVTLFLTLLTGILGFMKTQTIDLLKEKFRIEMKRNAQLGIFITGVVFVITSVLIMIIGYKYAATERWLISLVIMFAGLYMLITHMGSLEKYLVKINSDYIKRHIIEISFIRHHHKSGSKISIIAAWMLAFSIFLGGLSAATYPSLINNSASYSPYDLVYSKIMGKNQVEDSKIQNLLNQSGVRIKTVKQIQYLRNGAFNLLTSSEVNKEFRCDYKISKGEFLMVFQYDLKDGYKHEMNSPEMVTFNCGDEKIQLKSAGSDTRILFNRNPTFADTTLVLNDEDYGEIAAKSHEFWKGTMKLYTFDNWQKSEHGIATVQKYLIEKNQTDQLEQRYYKASSRIEAYITAKQSAKFLIFLISFIVLLFCIASHIMVHFKIRAEAEEEQRILSGLYRIGVTEVEMLRMIKHKDLYYYMPQTIIGLLIGVFYAYTYTIKEMYEYVWEASGYSLLIGLTIMMLQLAVTMRYAKRELLSFGI